MTQPETVVLLTRPRQASEAFCASLGDVGARVVIAPLQEITPVGAPVTLKPNESVIFTSRHAVERVENGMGHIAYCVGDATAEAARAARFSVLSASGTAADLLDLLVRERPEGPLIYLRGRHVSHDLSGVLQRRGFNVTSRIVYDQVGVPLAEELSGSLRRAARVIVPLFSPRSALLLAQELPDGVMPVVVAISEKTAGAWNRPKSSCLISEAPTASAMLDLTLRVLDSDSPS